MHTPWHACRSILGGPVPLPVFGELLTGCQASMAGPFPCWEEVQRGQSQGRGWLELQRAHAS